MPGPRVFATPEAWETWLTQNHGTSPGIWVRLAKKGSPLKSIRYTEALEAALCYGWIDAQKKAESAEAWLQRFTPRQPRSIWSKRNRQAALVLIAAGRMHSAGLAEVERAKNDGRWEAAYDSPATATIPEDLAAAFADNPRAKAFFATLDSANRYAILFRIQTVKRAETRDRRIRQFVEMLNRGEKLHP